LSGVALVADRGVRCRHCHDASGVPVVFVLHAFVRSRYVVLLRLHRSLSVTVDCGYTPCAVRGTHYACGALSVLFFGVWWYSLLRALSAPLPFRAQARRVVCHARTSVCSMRLLFVGLLRSITGEYDLFQTIVVPQLFLPRCVHYVSLIAVRVRSVV